jgi:glycosyltransferase involved in cell wall biosynthesis
VKRLLFFASSKNIGLTYHLATQSFYMSKLSTIDLYVISGEKEQFKGLKKHIIDRNIKYKEYFGLDEINNLFICLKGVLKFIRTNKFDILYPATNTHLVYCILYKLLSPKTKIIFTIHYFRSDKSVVKRMINIVSYFIVLKFFTKIVFTQSKSIQNYFKKYHIKSKVLSLGFSENFKKNNELIETFNIVYLANFTNNKRHLLLLESINNLLKTRNNVVLYLAGSGELKDKISNKVNELGLKDKIIFTGYLNREDVFTLLKKSNVGVTISKSETFGHCIVEPMFFSCPVISTKVGIAQDLLKDDYNGYLIDFEDKNKLVSSLEILIDNPQKLCDMGNNAYKTVKDNLSWEIIIKNFELLIDNI